MDRNAMHEFIITMNDKISEKLKDLLMTNAIF